MEEDLHASRVAITGAFSVGLAVSAVAAIPVGRWLDRHGPRALMTAVQKAGSADREKVRAQLASLQMESIVPGGWLRFQDHQAHYPFVVQQNQPDGTSPIVYPRELAEMPGVAPNPRCGAAFAQHVR